MVRKIIIVLSIVVVLFLIILGALFFISRIEPKEDESPLITKVREIFPFGKPDRNPDDLFPGEDTLPSTGENSSINSTSTSQVPRLRKIHPRPTSGAFQWSETLPSKETLRHIRFVDRATGHVHDTTTNSIETTKISNTTLPRVYEAHFSNKDSFLGRFLDDRNEEIIKTYFVSLKENTVKTGTSTSTSTPVQIQNTPKMSIGNYLEENIKEVSFSPQRNKIIYSIYENNGGSILISNSNGTNKRKVFSSALREWLLSWSTETNAIISTKPSGFANGFAYTLNTASGEITKLVGNVAGLTILPSPKNPNSFLVGTGGGSVSLSFLKKNTASDDQLLVISRTLPEKCVWSNKDSDIVYCAVPANIPTGVYPDDWYQGSTSFNDTIWKINVNTAQTNLVVIPEREVSEILDIINLELSNNDSYLTFLNKKDLSLWGYQIELPIVKTASSTATSTTQEKRATSTPPINQTATTTR